MSSWSQHPQGPSPSYLSPHQSGSQPPGLVREISKAKEAQYRQEGAMLIKEMGKKLQLQPTTFNTGIVLFHRFYSKKSFKDFPRTYMAAACLFVGGKAEEQPKKLKDLLPVFLHEYRHVPMSEMESKTKELSDMREKVLASERALLQTLEFDLQVTHPFTPLIQFALKLTVEGQEKMPNPLVQQACNYISDSYLTSMCVEYEPDVIAGALLHLTGTQNSVTFVFVDQTLRAASGDNGWWAYLLPGTPLAILEAIGGRMLDLYNSQSNGGGAEAPAQGQEA